MLHALRNSVGSLGAKILLGLLVLAFAAWGIEGVFAGRTQTVAATVGEAEIPLEEFAREFEVSTRAVRLTSDQARQNGFDRVVLDRMATRTALNEEARALGIDASDEAIVSFIQTNPQFRDAYGQFDRSRYENVLQMNRLRQAQYESTIRNELARDAMLSAVTTGTTAPRALSEVLYRYNNEQRTFDYIALSPSDVDEPPEPTDAQLATFHEENAVQFTAPEYRKITYVALTIEDIAAAIETSDEELRAEYDSRIAEFTTPERRTIEQIVFDTEEEATEAAEKIAAGESFAKLAEARGLSAQDVSLGRVTKDDLPGALSDAAFAQSEAGIAEPVGTALGWSLLNIRSITPESITSFEDKKEALKTEITTLEAREIMPSRSLDLDDQLAGGSTLAEAAEQAIARYTPVDALDATGRDPKGDRLEGLPDDPEFLTRVFETDVGEEPVLIEAANGDFFAFSVEGITPATLRPLDTVRDSVAGAWEAAEREKALAALTAELKDKLDNGATLADLAEDLEQEVATAGPGTRNDRSLGLSGELLIDLFDASEGDSIEGNGSDGLSRLVGIVTEITPATSEDDQQALERQTEAYAASLARDIENRFAITARERHVLQPNELAIEALFTGQGGMGGY